MFPIVGTILEFATRGQATNDEGTQRIGNLFYGTDGWLWIDGDGRKWQSYRGRKNEKGPGADSPDTTAGSDPLVLTSIESPHYRNFVDAIRAGDPKLLTCDILEGHLSSALPQLANIAYRVGHALVFDGKSETFVDDKKADRLLTREYRKGSRSRSRCRRDGPPRPPADNEAGKPEAKSLGLSTMTELARASPRTLTSPF